MKSVVFSRIEGLTQVRKSDIIDWNFDEDRSRISKGYGPENMTRLRRFAVGLIKSKGVKNVAQKMRQLSFSTRLVLDYLKITGNSQRASALQS